MAPRAYYHQPVWKRIVVIGAGPAVNIAIALAILFFLFLHYGNYETTQTVGKILPGSPAATALKPGDEIVAFDGKSYAGLGTVDRLENFIDDVASHRCAGKQVEGCTSRDPGHDHDPTRRRAAHGGAPARIRRQGRTARGSASPTGKTTSNTAPLGAAEEAVDKTWFVTKGTVSVFARLFQEKPAQAALRRRRRQRRRQRKTRPEHRGNPAARRRRQPLARADQPLPVPAARRRSHLLEPGREVPRQAGPVSRSWSAPA